MSSETQTEAQAQIPDNWDLARRAIVPFLLNQPAAQERYLGRMISTMAFQSLIWCDLDTGLMLGIEKGMLDVWQKEETEVMECALRNFDAMLEGAQIEVMPDSGHKVAVVKLPATTLKANVLTSARLKQKVSPVIGWPIWAVAPCADFVLLFNDKNIIPNLGPTVYNEFMNSEQPVSTEVFEITDEGVVAIGNYMPQMPEKQ